MTAIEKNVLVNAAMCANQNVEKTMELAAGAVNIHHLLTAKTMMRAGMVISHQTINERF